MHGQLKPPEATGGQVGRRKALALGRLDKLEGGGDSQGTPTARVVTVDGERVLLRVLGRDPCGEAVGEFDLAVEGRASEVRNRATYT